LRAPIDPPSVPHGSFTGTRKIKPNEELVKIASKSHEVVEKLSETGKFPAFQWISREAGRPAVDRK
jgi:hypothetical protein